MVVVVRYVAATALCAYRQGGLRAWGRCRLCLQGHVSDL